MAKNVKYITLFDKLPCDFGDVEITAKELDEVEEKQWIVFPMRSGGNENSRNNQS